MTKLKHKFLHVTVGDQAAWDLLATELDQGWNISWNDYAGSQYHFLLVHDAVHV